MQEEKHYEYQYHNQNKYHFIAGPSLNVHSGLHGHRHHGQPQKVLEERISFNVAQNIIESEPPHCFLYDDCNRFVHQATKDCPLSK